MIKPKIGICKRCKANCDEVGVESKEKPLYANGLCQYHYKSEKLYDEYKSGKAQKKLDEKNKKAKELRKNMVFPASKLKAGKKKPVKKKFPKKTGEAEMFKQIWEEREHICINCKVYLGEEPIVHYFSHRLGKGANPELRLDKDNIDLLCRDCHYARDFQGKDKFNKRTK